MVRPFVHTAIWLALLLSSPAFAGEQKITLAVEGMFSDADAPILRGTIKSVTGVIDAVVSYENKTVVVTYDDTKATIAMITEAIRDAGYRTNRP